VNWYQEDGAPDVGKWWWAIEHRGHPAFYLRALMAGDFAPGRRPAARHARALDGSRVHGDLLCGTCGAIPDSVELEPIERHTGQRGFLQERRVGRKPWPPATEASSCWECSNRRIPATEDFALEEGVTVKVCGQCAEHLARWGAA
jgi:hypothetical protein